MNSLLKLAYKLSFFGMLVFGVQTGLGSRASAVLDLKPDPNIPAANKNYLRNCDSYGQSPATTTWVSEPGRPWDDSINAPYGSTSLSLQLNFAGAVCTSSSAVTDSRNRVTGVGATPTINSVTGLAGSDRTVSFNPYNLPGVYNDDQTGFSVTSPGNFTAPGVYAFHINFKSINRFRDGHFECVHNGAGSIVVSSLNDFDRCPETPVFVSFFVDVATPSPPVCQLAWTSNEEPIITQNFQIMAMVRNPNGSPIRIDSASASGYNSVSGLGVMPSGVTRTLSTGNISFETPGRRAFNWTINWSTVGGGAGGAITCSTHQPIFVNVVAPVQLGCNPYGPSAIAAGESFNLGNNVVNSNSSVINIAQVTLEGPGFSRNATGTGSLAAGASRDFNSGPIVINDGGDHTLTWRVNWNVPNSEYVSTATCNASIRVILPPVCTAGASGGTYPVGQLNSMTRVYLRNDNPYALGVNSAQFSVPAQHGHPTVNGQDSSIQNIPSGSARTYDADDFRINLPSPGGSGYNGVSWVVSWSASGYNGNTSCSSDLIHITAQQPTCVVTPLQYEVGEPFTATVTVANTNAVPVDIYQASYTIASVSAGNSSNPPVPPTQQVPAANSRQFSSSNITISNAGAYAYEWHVHGSLGVVNWGRLNCGSASVVRIVEIPYFKIFNGDVSTGGLFGTGTDVDACNAGSSVLPTSGTGRLYGFTRGSGTGMSGSSVQYAVHAFGAVEGVYSASQRTSQPNPARGLTFANTSGTYGGNFGTRQCISNYWRGSSGASALSSATLDIASLSDNDAFVRSGNLTISDTNGPSSDASVNAAVYVNGDLTITNSITNADVTWTNRDAVGTLYLVVKGNIYINSGVGQIDGLLAAIPRDDGTGGEIFTCRDSANASPAAYPGYNSCRNQLVVNGAVVAKQIHLGRVGGTLRNSLPQEGTNPNQAEIFNFTPEFFVKRPAQPAISTDLHRSDSVITLPPVL